LASGANTARKQVDIIIATSMRSWSLKATRRLMLQSKRGMKQRVNLINISFILRDITIMIRLKNMLEHLDLSLKLRLICFTIIKNIQCRS
jgi:hypothetical protein